MNYTDKTAVEAYTDTTIAAPDEAQLIEWIEAMSEYIDEQVGYPVHTNTTSTRLYDGTGYNELPISPVNTITTVTVDGVTITPIIAPYNETTKTCLILRGDVFPNDIANVAVTGKHCLKATLPEPIKLACTILVAGIVNQSKNQTDGVKSEKIGEYQVTYATEEEQKQFKWAKSVIDTYKRIAF